MDATSAAVIPACMYEERLQVNTSVAFAEHTHFVADTGVHTVVQQSRNCV